MVKTFLVKKVPKILNFNKNIYEMTGTQKYEKYSYLPPGHIQIADRHHVKVETILYIIKFNILESYLQLQWIASAALPEE